jgi:hypothetical protein
MLNNACSHTPCQCRRGSTSHAEQDSLYADGFGSTLVGQRPPADPPIRNVFAASVARDIERGYIRRGLTPQSAEWKNDQALKAVSPTGPWNASGRVNISFGGRNSAPEQPKSVTTAVAPREAPPPWRTNPEHQQEGSASTNLLAADGNPAEDLRRRTGTGIDFG